MYFAIEASLSNPDEVEAVCYFLSRWLINALLPLYDPSQADPTQKYRMGSPAPKTKPVFACETIFDR